MVLLETFQFDLGYLTLRHLLYSQIALSRMLRLTVHLFGSYQVHFGQSCNFIIYGHYRLVCSVPKYVSHRLCGRHYKSDLFIFSTLKTHKLKYNVNPYLNPSPIFCMNVLSEVFIRKSYYLFDGKKKEIKLLSRNKKQWI